MRQLRTKPKLCRGQSIILQCDYDYNLFKEENQSFKPGWTNETTTEEYSSSILKAFQYQLSKNLDTYMYAGDYETYSGNGYVYEFRGSLSNLKSNLSELHQLQWIDQNTRAIFIQMTLYNPNVQLFTSVILLGEFLSTGGVFPSAHFQPMEFYGNKKIFFSNIKIIILVFTSVLQLVGTIIYMSFIIYFMIKEIQLLIELKSKYFRQFWSLIHLSIIVCSWASIGVYIWRFRESNRISQLFKQTNGYIYINLQLAIYINNLLTYLLSFCCFFGMIKFIHLFRINSRLSLFIQTLEISAKELISFLMMFSIVFMAFVILFYLLFVSKINSCADLLGAVQMLFQMTVMKYSTREFIGADATLGPLCFSIFILIVVFICLSMFLSIINRNFRRVLKNRRESEMLSFMLQRFLRWTGKYVLFNEMMNYTGEYSRFEKSKSNRKFRRTRFSNASTIF